MKRKTLGLPTKEPHNMNAVMIDLETMSTKPNAAILSIGAVLFDPWGTDTEDSIKNDTNRLFLASISIESNEKEGRHISASTVSWWLKQSEAARHALLSPSDQLRGALERFKQWIARQQPRIDRAWAKSPEFDCVILRDAFESTGLMWPFQYWNSRDVRTAVELAFPEGDEPTIGVGVAHNALDDAIRQALTVQSCHRRLHPR